MDNELWCCAQTKRGETRRIYMFYYRLVDVHGNLIDCIAVGVNAAYNYKNGYTTTRLIHNNIQQDNYLVQTQLTEQTEEQV